MPWFYVDDAFADSKPVMRLAERLRNEAIGLWVRCGAWSAKEETDGRIPLDVVRQFDGTARTVRALVSDAELWDAENAENWRKNREFLFRNWEKWQRTHAENEARRKADAERQASHRRTKKGRNFVPIEEPSTSVDDEMSRCDTGPDYDNVGDASSKVVSRCESQRPYPDPTQPNPLLVTSNGGVTEGSASEAPRPVCLDHEENSDGPCIKCKRRREWDTANAAAVQADELEAKRRQREIAANCPMCHGTNVIDVADDSVRKCDHLLVVAHA